MALQKLLTHILLNKILYIGNHNYLIHKNGKIEDVGTHYAHHVSVVVISKTHYFETVKKFPFPNLRDIQLAVETDMPEYCPFPTDAVLIKKALDSGDTPTVNLWFVKQEVKQRLKGASPLFVFPETAVLALNKEDVPRVYSVIRNTKELLVHVGPDRLARSVISNKSKSTIDDFLRSIGGNTGNCGTTEMDEKDYLVLLRSILSNVPTRSFSTFKNPDAFLGKADTKQLVRGIGIAFSLFLLYTAVSMAIPYFTKQQLIEENQALSSNLNELVKNKGMIEKYFERQQTLAKKINSYTYKVPLINQLSSALPPQSVLERLTVSGNMVEIRGTTPKASKLLEALRQVKGIRNAKFTSPLREDGTNTKEIFTLTFIYDKNGN